jgi:hypothetical protein
MMDETQLEAGEVRATPEEQAMLEQAVDVAIQMIHGEGPSGDKIAQMVLQSQDIAQGIGQAIATVVIGVQKSMEVPDDMTMALAEEVADELVALAVEAGALSEDEVTDEFTDKMVSHGYSRYLEAKEAMGELDPAALESQVNEAKSLMGQGGQQPQQPQQPAAKGGLLQRAAAGG